MKTITIPLGSFGSIKTGKTLSLLPDNGHESKFTNKEVVLPDQSFIPTSKLERVELPEGREPSI